MKTFTPMYNMVSSKFFHFGDKYPTANEVLDSDDYIVMPGKGTTDGIGNRFIFCKMGSIGQFSSNRNNTS